MARFAIGGFQHETNTFAPVKASFRDFEMADGWPGLTRGDAMLTAFEGINLPIAGFLVQARRQGHDLLPTLWCSPRRRPRSRPTPMSGSSASCSSASQRWARSTASISTSTARW